MARAIFYPNKAYYDPLTILDGVDVTQGLDVRVLAWILFKAESNFDAMEYNSKSRSFPNGHYKTGTIKYKSGQVMVPLAGRILAFERSEYYGGMGPRGVLALDSVVVCPLRELTDDEMLGEGFKNQKDMLWQMTEMPERFYKNLTPESIVSYWKWPGLDPFSVAGPSSDVLLIRDLNKAGYLVKLMELDKTDWTDGFNRWIK